jgi:hypothetical protein
MGWVIVEFSFDTWQGRKIIFLAVQTSSETHAAPFE